jgi:hypothetical protein
LRESGETDNYQCNPKHGERQRSDTGRDQIQTQGDDQDGARDRNDLVSWLAEHFACLLSHHRNRKQQREQHQKDQGSS